MTPWWLPWSAAWSMVRVRRTWAARPAPRTWAWQLPPSFSVVDQRLDAEAVHQYRQHDDAERDTGQLLGQVGRQAGLYRKHQIEDGADAAHAEPADQGAHAFAGAATHQAHIHGQRPRHHKQEGGDADGFVGQFAQRNHAAE